jgi:hypothetical protein
MTTNEAIIMIVVGVSIFIFIAGYILGQLVEKRKRDKEMAGIVAERLLRKPEVPSSGETQPGHALANANMNSQLGAMQGQANMGLGNYLIGGNPILSQGLPSRFSAIRRSQ